MPRRQTPKRRDPEATRPTVPGYKFAAKKTGLLPWKWASDRLKKSRQYWIATTRPDGAPHLMVIWGVWLEDSFWFSTGAASRKARNLAVNPRCVDRHRQRGGGGDPGGHRGVDRRAAQRV